MNIIEKAKALWAINKQVKEMGKMNIPTEIKSSEGRLTLMLNAIMLYSAVQGFLPPPLTAKIAAVSVAGYAIARALVKAAEAIAKITASTKDDAIVAEAEGLLDAAAAKVAPK